MREDQFLKTMIELIKYDDYSNKDALLTVLRNSFITFDKTNSFTNKSWQHWEYIDLRVPIPMLKIARELQKDFEKAAYEIYTESDNYDIGGLRIKPKLIELEAEEDTEHDVVFNEIKETIIQGIRSAKYLIWAAVAWFTDNEILNELILRKKDGINIRIITSDEKSNSVILDRLEKNFEVIKVPLWGNYLSNRMHDKFCIIDLEYVMHGTYNWSKNAKENDETLATALDKDFVRKFADEFIRLLNEHA